MRCGDRFLNGGSGGLIFRKPFRRLHMSPTDHRLCVCSAGGKRLGGNSHQVGKCNAVEPVADVEARALEGSSSVAAQRGKKPRLLPTAADAERAKRERATYAPLGPDFNLENMVRATWCSGIYGYVWLQHGRGGRPSPSVITGYVKPK